MMMSRNATVGVDTDIGEPWCLQLIARNGAPPLRVTGRRLFHHTCHSGGCDLFVSLWEKRKSGFVLAHSLPNLFLCPDHAVSVPTLDAAMDTLSAFCSDAKSAPVAATEPVGADIDSVLRLILSASMKTEQLQSFFILCGQALAQWDEWAELQNRNMSK